MGGHEQQPAASVTSQSGYFTNLKMLAPNDVWAVGYLIAGGYVMLHYNGVSWSEVTNKPISGNSLAGTSTALYSFGSEISHLNGSAWTIEEPLTMQTNPSLVASVTLPGGEIWAAGRTVDANNIFKTLVYRSSGAALPVQLINFSVSRHEQGVLLNWSTSAEKNAKRFIVEHSTDGAVFQAIATVNAVGNSTVTNNYSFIHPRTVRGNNYYRLTLVDNDGSRTVYPVRMIVLGGVSQSLSVYPNPARSYVVVSYVGAQHGIITIWT